MNKKAKYIANDQLEYTSDISCTKIYQREANCMYVISYPEAAIWDMVQQDYTFNEIANMMAAITKNNKSETAIWISMIIENWLDNQLLKQ
jgi:hypothetical protein